MRNEDRSKHFVYITRAVHHCKEHSRFSIFVTARVSRARFDMLRRVLTDSIRSIVVPVNEVVFHPKIERNRITLKRPKRSPSWQHEYKSVDLVATSKGDLQMRVTLKSGEKLRCDGEQMSALDEAFCSIPCLANARLLCRELSSEASDIAGNHPFLGELVNKPWNKGGAGYRLSRMLGKLVEGRAT